jgi:hypothetical protein
MQWGEICNKPEPCCEGERNENKNKNTIFFLGCLKNEPKKIDTGSYIALFYIFCVLPSLFHIIGYNL